MVMAMVMVTAMVMVFILKKQPKLLGKIKLRKDWVLVKNQILVESK
jgi:hypothetical protein